VSIADGVHHRNRRRDDQTQGDEPRAEAAYPRLGSHGEPSFRYYHVNELRGYRRDIGLDGLPTDPNHPFNRAQLATLRGIPLIAEPISYLIELPPPIIGRVVGRQWRVCWPVPMERLTRRAHSSLFQTSENPYDLTTP
jgi:hypothetical protein